jgi:hypothetical protein
MMTFSANRDPAAVETHPLAGAPAPTAFVSNSAAAAVAALTENSAVGAPSANAESTEAAAEVGRSIGVDGTLNTMPNQISAIVVAESALSGPILAEHTRDEELGSEWKQWAEIIGAAVIIGGVSVRALTRRRSGQNAQAGPLVSPFFG